MKCIWKIRSIVAWKLHICIMSGRNIESESERGKHRTDLHDFSGCQSSLCYFVAFVLSFPDFEIIGRWQHACDVAIRFKTTKCNWIQIALAYFVSTGIFRANFPNSVTTSFSSIVPIIFRIEMLLNTSAEFGGSMTFDKKSSMLSFMHTDFTCKQVFRSDDLEISAVEWFSISSYVDCV